MSARDRHRSAVAALVAAKVFGAEFHTARALGYDTPQAFTSGCEASDGVMIIAGMMDAPTVTGRLRIIENKVGRGE